MLARMLAGETRCRMKWCPAALLITLSCQVVSAPCDRFDSGCNPLFVSLLARIKATDPEGRVVLLSPSTSSLDLFEIDARTGNATLKLSSGGPSNFSALRTMGHLGVVQSPSDLTLVDASSGTIVARSTASETNGLSIGLLDAPRRLYYVTHSADQALFLYGIREDRPQKIQTTALGSTNFTHLALPPDRRFLYLANTGAVELTHYSLHSDGTLASIGANMTPPANAEALTVEPTGRFLYLLSGTTLHTLNINSTDGSLTNSGLSTANVANGSARFFYSHSGRHIYIYSDAGLVTCEIQANGALVSRSVLSPPRGDNSASAFKSFSGMDLDFSRNFFFIASVSPAGLYTGSFDPVTELPVLHGMIPTAGAPAAVGYFQR